MPFLFNKANSIPGSESIIVVGTSHPSSVETQRRLNYHQRVFPNPVINTLNIASVEGASPLKIIDMMGRAVISGMVLDRATLSVDVTMLPAGIYFVTVDDIRDAHPVLVGKVLLVGK